MEILVTGTTRQSSFIAIFHTLLSKFEFYTPVQTTFQQIHPRNITINVFKCYL